MSLIIFQKIGAHTRQDHSTNRGKLSDNKTQHKQLESFNFNFSSLHFILYCLGKHWAINLHINKPTVIQAKKNNATTAPHLTTTLHSSTNMNKIFINYNSHVINGNKKTLLNHYKCQRLFHNTES